MKSLAEKTDGSFLLVLKDFKPKSRLKYSVDVTYFKIW